MREVRTGQIYRHFKGGLYQIIAVATHSETNERYVVYQALYGGMDVWVRPYDMIHRRSVHMKYPDVQQKYRFELMNTLLNAAGNGDMWNSTHPVADGNAAGIDDDRHDTSQYAEDDRQDTEQYVGAGEQTGESVSDGQGTQIESRSADGVDTRLLDFLDAPTYQDKINYLNLIRNNIDDDLINNIAAAMDITINDGPIDTRFFSLRSCLMTKAKYECARR